MKKNVWKRIAEYAFVAVIFILIAAIYAYVIREASEMLEASHGKSYAAAKDFLKASGVKGAVIVSVLEMLQMIVVFIPAEFVQISAGLAFPVFIALPVCMFGVFLGATAIFVIVRCLHIRLEILGKREGRIGKFVRRINKDTPISVIMYILFVMPVVPFGAIAYFASSGNIGYRKYITTCVTGVIPSILSSCILGNVMFYCIGKGRGTFIAAVVTVIVLMALLLIITASAIKKRYFIKTLRKPDAFLYTVLYFFINLYYKSRVKTDRKNCEKLCKSPVLILGAHTSFHDFYYVASAMYPRKPNVVTNRYYFHNGALRVLLNSLGAIPKSLFTNDLEAVKGILTAAKSGSDIVLFPEGRLSTDGTGFTPAGGTAALAKLICKIKLPVYFFSTHGGYFVKPKWRDRLCRGNVGISLKSVISEEEIKTLSAEEIESIIGGLFTYDESVTEEVRTRDVSGLESILYRCPECKKEFCLSSRVDALVCEGCGEVFTFDGKYTSRGMTVSDWSYTQKKAIIEENDLNIEDFCEVHCFNGATGGMKKAGEGHCEISDGVLRYEGTLLGENVLIENTTASLYALAFSCGEEFEFYYKNKLLYFYPAHRERVVKWSLIWDILVQKQIQENQRDEDTENGKGQ